MRATIDNIVVEEVEEVPTGALELDTQVQRNIGRVVDSAHFDVFVGDVVAYLINEDTLTFTHNGTMYKAMPYSNVLVVLSTQDEV